MPRGEADIPTQVQVGPHRYAVTLDSLRLLREHPGWAGMSKRHTLEIVLLDDMVPSRAREVLWHEVKHAVADVIGWCSEEALEEEAAIGRTAAMELAVLRANPALSAWLLAPEVPHAPGQ